MNSCSWCSLVQADQGGFIYYDALVSGTKTTGQLLFVWGFGFGSMRGTVSLKQFYKPPPNFSKRFFDCVPGANGFCAISANFLFSFGLFSLATIFNDTGIFKQQTSCYFAHNNFNASLFLIILCPLSKFSLTVRVPSATGVTCILSCTYHCSPSPL